MITLGITLGDPGGIGPEIVFRTLAKRDLPDNVRIQLYGPASVLEDTYYQPWLSGLTRQHRLAECRGPGDFVCINTHSAGLEIEPNCHHAHNGQMAYEAIQSAVTDALSGKIAGIVTAPIAKDALLAAGVPYSGHTTMLKALTQSKAVSMAFHTPQFQVVLATIHHAYHTIPSLLTPEILRLAVDNSYRLAQQLGLKTPRIALAALNPHAGENGMFGSEEQDILIPFVNALPSDRTVSGPLPADSLFYRACQGEFDIVIALYHDQGLIPVKMLHFHDAVNLTLGLPFVRTSPDHGTAFERAFQNAANPDSFASALKLAIRLASNGKDAPG